MRIAVYSDLHLEFLTQCALETLINNLVSDSDIDLVVLAGDIVSVGRVSFLDKLSNLLNKWNKPVIYVLGNHEYYGNQSILKTEIELRNYLSSNHPNVHLLLNDWVDIDGLNIFGGTMWTDFNKSNPIDLEIARSRISDYNAIKTNRVDFLKPLDTVELHNRFKCILLKWLNITTKPRVIISHHAPCINPLTQYVDSPLQAAFNSEDMLEVINTHQPDLWIYGHTHEADDRMIGNTRVVSNPLGYLGELTNFNPLSVIEI